jgi:uncharacterized protein YjiS (DUF1127 family)
MEDHNKRLFRLETIMLLKQIQSGVRAYRDYRALVRELSVLSEQGLRDLGVSRGDIEATALEFVARHRENAAVMGASRGVSHANAAPAH